MAEIVRIQTRKETGDHQVVHPETNSHAVLLESGETLQAYITRLETRINELGSKDSNSV